MTFSIRIWVRRADPFSSTAKRIAATGQVGEETSTRTGYSVITTDSLDAAVALAKGCPVLKGGATISGFETPKAMGSPASM